jgi:hypothetical protein
MRRAIAELESATMLNFEEVISPASHDVVSLTKRFLQNIRR